MLSYIKRHSIIASLIFIILTICTIIFIYNRNSTISLFETKLYTLSRSLENRRIKSLNKIVSFTKQLTTHSLIYYYTGYDCSTCVENGFELINEINHYAKRENIFVIGTNTNIGRDQVNYDYRNYIYSDEKQLLRKELKYIYTPVFLLIDTSFDIKKVYFPTRTETNTVRDDFIKSIKQAF
jgi:predicted permease